MHTLYFLLALFVSLVAKDLRAQSTADLKFEYLNYDNDTLLLGYYIGEKILVKDTLYAESKYQFEYKQDELLESGMYMLVSLPDKKFFQFLINQDDQNFMIRTDFLDKGKTVVTGSIENESFFSYLDYLNQQRIKISEIDSAVETKELDKNQGDERKKELAKVVETYQYSLIEKYPDYVFSMIIGANMTMHFPEFEGTDDERELQKYLYYKKHYFDLIDLGHPAILRTPFLHKRVMYYMDNLTTIQADSIIQSVDFLLEKMQTAEKTFQFYLSHFLNLYGNSKYIGLDKVYVHLALNYYDLGLAPWASEGNRMEIVANAKKMEPTLLGKTAPDFDAKDLDNDAVFTLSKFNSDYTILVFWAPDCGHCTKAIPYLTDVQEKYGDQGVKVVTVCNKAGEKYKTCHDGVSEKKMTPFINLGDQYRIPYTLNKYNVMNTPLILILDKNKEILLKRIPAENLDSIMEQVIKKHSGSEDEQGG